MLMLEDRFFQQEWVQEMSNEDFRMLLYLLHFASKKTGIVELNMRQINFAANTGKLYTKEDVLERFGNMLCMIPGRENTAIFPDYIATNWAKNGKPIDTIRNPLFRSVVSELASFGMTIADVNSLAKKKVSVLGEECDVVVEEPKEVPAKKKEPAVSNDDIDTMFTAFWNAYPKSCPRKDDKKKCRIKFGTILSKSKDPVAQFNKIMEGLSVWVNCDDWNKDGGQYIRSPLRWLNNDNWNDEPRKGGTNGTASGRGCTANSNYKSSDASGIF